MHTDIEIQRYSPALRQQWNEMVSLSRNATFLFHRDYMDYHADRYTDCSLIAVRSGKLIGMLPCCHHGAHAVSSHAGLTYGGWILPPSHVDGSDMLGIFSAWLAFLHTEGVREVIYKPLPRIYARKPSDEDLYALWRNGFTIASRQLSSSVDLRRDWKFDMSKRQQVRRASRSGAIFSRSERWEEFWILLCNCLRERHEASPVHSLQEILLLKERFPEQIRLFTATDPAGEIHAGVVIYDTGTVAHSQYAATTAEGRRHYLLTALYHHLMTDEYAGRYYFDFGTSNEQSGRVLNAGLLSQKFSMGGSGTAYDTYSLTL